MIFNNPVHGTIHSKSWSRPSGNLDFKLTQPFGCTGVLSELPYGNCLHFHRGIDVANGRYGAEVLTVAPGVVTLAGEDSYSGNALRVVIDHNNGDWFSLYYHLKDYGVKVGQTLARGQVLGHVGDTGWAQGPHLHFEVHSSSDRLSFFDAWPHLAQNVTVKPVGSGVNIRLTAGGTIYAVTKADGHIHRSSDDADLGATNAWRKWGGVEIGPSYTVNGSTSTRWERMYLGGDYRYVASLLATRSMT